MLPLRVLLLHTALLEQTVSWLQLEEGFEGLPGEG